ncbi:MFS transporter [Streptomyces sp. NBC_01353]|uniref:MFS transporter n=1 Tax=Streptomyces sp. NBC_01353 TaxID=2903835 RepID=UPI002E345C2F|nr:MFS transporter [Streptomyces sp. NBC_01353]
MGRAVRLCLGTAFLARLAEEGFPVALVLLALARTGDATLGALVLTAWMAPHIAAAPVTGALAERVRRPALFYGGALAGFAAAVACLAYVTGRAPVAVTLIVAALGGSCGPVVSGGLSGLVASLVTEGPARDRAYAWDAAAYNAAAVAGPALAGVVAALAGPAAAVTVLAASAALATLPATVLLSGRRGSRPDGEPLSGGRTASRPGRASGAAAGSPPGLTSRPGAGSPPGLTSRPGAGSPPAPGPGAGFRRSTGAPAAMPEPRTNPREKADVPRRSLRGDLVAGLVAVWGVRELRAVTAATCLGFLGLGGLTTTAVLLASERGRPGDGGLLMTAFAVGALVGSLAVDRVWPRVPAGRLVGVTLLGTGAALGAAALVSSPWLCAALFGAAGLCDGPLLTATLRIRADHAPADVRTQVFTLGAGLKISAAACGAALTGLAAGTQPAAALLLAAATLQFAAALHHLLRRVPAPKPDVT